MLEACGYCFVKVSGPLFVTVPNSPLEVISVVPVRDVRADSIPFDPFSFTFAPIPYPFTHVHDPKRDRRMRWV